MNVANLGTANTVSFTAGNPGSYLVIMNISAATSATALSNNSVTGGTSGGPPLFTASATRDATTNVYSLAGTTTAIANLQTTLIQTAAVGTLIINPSTLVTSGTGSMDLFIIAIPSTILTLSEKDKEFESRCDVMQRKLDYLLARLSISDNWDTPFIEKKDEDEDSGEDVEPVSLSDSTILKISNVIRSSSNKK